MTCLQKDVMIPKEEINDLVFLRQCSLRILRWENIFFFFTQEIQKLSIDTECGGDSAEQVCPLV